MNAQKKLQTVLQKKFSEMQSKNERFSLRAFSRKVGVSPSAMSEILRGYRHASRKTAVKISKKLMLDPQENFELLKWFPVICGKEKDKKKRGVFKEVDSKDYLLLEADQFQSIAEWSHYAILSLINTKDFTSSAAWMAERLGISVSKINDSLGRLERLGLIEKNAEGTIKRVYRRVHTTDDVQNTALQKAHLSDMEIAADALKSVPVEFRDFTSLSIPLDPEILSQAKDSIRKFRDEISTLLVSRPGSEVYQMSIYLYPLTKLRKQGKNEK